MNASRVKRSTVPEKVAWLRTQPELWGKSRTEVVSAMKVAGLISPTTSPVDVKLKTLIELARQSVDFQSPIEPGFFSRVRVFRAPDHTMQHTKDGQQVEIIETYFPLFGERASDKAVFWAGMTFCGLEKLRAKQNAIAVASYAEAKIIHALTRLQKEVQAKDAAAIRSRGTWDIALKQDFTGEQPSDFLVPVLEKILELVLPEGLLVRRGYRYTSNPEGQP